MNASAGIGHGPSVLDLEAEGEGFAGFWVLKVINWPVALLENPEKLPCRMFPAS
jgi:hypothetical protein